MVSLLVAVLNHNNLVETEHQDDISFYMEQVYRQLQKNYPEYGITEEEIENVSHLAPIHDIGKIRVSIEILNKNARKINMAFLRNRKSCWNLLFIHFFSKKAEFVQNEYIIHTKPIPNNKKQ